MRKHLALLFGVVAGSCLLWWLIPSDFSLADGARAASTFIVDRLAESNGRWPVLARLWVAILLMIGGCAVERLLMSHLQQGGGSAESTLLSGTAQLVGVTALAGAVAYAGLSIFRSVQPESSRSAIGYYANNTAYAATRPQRYFALTPAGVRYSDRREIDPEYGIPLEPLTPEIATNLEQKPEGRRPLRIPPAVLDRVVYFDATSGEPRVWYASSPRGVLEAFDAPGRHPAYGTTLRPVTPPVVERLIAQAAEFRTSPAPAGDEHYTPRPAPGNAAFVSRSVDVAPATHGTLVLACDSAGRVDGPVTAALAGALAADGMTLRRVLDDDTCEAALSGDAGALAVSESTAAARRIVIARIMRAEAGVDTGRVATVTIDARIFSPQDGFASMPLVSTATRSSATSTDPSAQALTQAFAGLLNQLPH